MLFGTDRCIWLFVCLLAFLLAWFLDFRGLCDLCILCWVGFGWLVADLGCGVLFCFVMLCSFLLDWVGLGCVVVLLCCCCFVVMLVFCLGVWWCRFLSDEVA